jgi:hypothetical protein
MFARSSFDDIVGHDRQMRVEMCYPDKARGALGNETPPVHQSSWWRSGIAVRCAGAAASEAAPRSNFPSATLTSLRSETRGVSAWREFFSELPRLGYVEGDNLIVERYSAEWHHERCADFAREIVNRNPDVIVTGPNPL